MKSSMWFDAQSPEAAPLFDVLASVPEGRAAIQAAAGRVDAAALVEHAAMHGVSALVADALSAAGVSLPAEPAARLQADAGRAISGGLRIRRLTTQVLDALAPTGITPVLLKGASLAERLFPEQPLARPSTDVDLLVEPAVLERVGGVLETMGLVRQHDDGLDDVAEEHHHVSWAGRGGALVEVHFRLFSGFGGHHFDDEALRARLRSGQFQGRAVQWLDPADEFVYLATHAANHTFLRASWLLDLQRILATQPAFDWPALATQCRQAGFFQAVASALDVLARTLRVPVPLDARRAFRISRVRRLGHRLLFSAARLEDASISTHDVAAFGARLWLVDAPRDGLQHLVDGARRYVRRARRTRT